MGEYFDGYFENETALIESRTLGNPLDCVAVCTAMESCQSVNYRQITQLCKVYGKRDVSELTCLNEFAKRLIHFWKHCAGKWYLKQ